MANLSQTDKHAPGVQTGQPNPEQVKQPLKAPVPHDANPLKKELHDVEKEQKTGTNR
jgi:hypothetical protein